MAVDPLETAANDTLDANSRHGFDWTDHGSTSAAVVEAVGAVSGDDVTEMTALDGSVDTDALDRLVSTPDDEATLTVEFPFDGHEVAVASSGDGWVR